MSVNAGLGGLVVVGALLYYTGAGDKLWASVQRLDASCYSAMSSLGTEITNSVCGTLSKAIHGLGNAGGQIRQNAQVAWQSMFGQIKRSGANEWSSLSQQLGQKIDGFASSSDVLSRMMSEGPHGLNGASASQQVQQAFDSFAIGQHFLAGNGNGNGAAQALPWLKQGASQPGYGLMSQLSLGDLYRTGGNGVAANPEQAKVYYQKAMDSLGVLSQTNTPQAQQLLQSLPASPQVIGQQLRSMMQQMNQFK